MPHSEISGSTGARTSPELIAACHVLHRLYMPRHSPDALTSRLRVHTTNDNTGEVLARYMMWMIYLSQIINNCEQHQPDRYRTALPRHRLKKPIHNVKERPNASYPLIIERNSFLHSWSNAHFRQGNGGAYRDRTDDLMLAKQPLSQLS